MQIIVRDNVKVENLRKSPDLINKFGIVATHINDILARYGYVMISAVPPGSLDIDMVYVDVVSHILYEVPSKYPMELQIALKEVNSMFIEIEDNSVINWSYKALDMEDAYKYETFGWSEELLSIWGLASRAANISLKQIRVAIASVYDIPGAAFIQVVKSAKTNPKFETITIATVEEFMAICEELDYIGIDVINVVINKPIPKSNAVVPISYAVNPSKYVGMMMRG